jgi:hypothetical protein
MKRLAREKLRERQRQKPAATQATAEPGNGRGLYRRRVVSDEFDGANSGWQSITRLL